jgi:orotidine-5'-phosphate decarboxylase
VDLKKFIDRLAAVSSKNESLVCVGLDPDAQRMPVSDVFDFNRAIIDATKDLVCTYKPNLAFYESRGIQGLESLKATVKYIHEVAPDVMVLGDAKRGDIDSTNVHHARALFDYWGFDAVTVNGFAGGEALEPFLEYEDRAVFVWCRSSNPSARELQDAAVVTGDGDKMPYYDWMSRMVGKWNSRGNVGLVVGATYPEELRVVRSNCPGMPILVPGIGAQTGELDSSVKFGLDADRPNMLISSSRGILYASSDVSDFASSARAAAEGLRASINRVLVDEGRGW